MAAFSNVVYFYNKKTIRASTDSSICFTDGSRNPNTNKPGGAVLGQGNVANPFDRNKRYAESLPSHRWRWRWLQIIFDLARFNNKGGVQNF